MMLLAFRRLVSEDWWHQETESEGWGMQETGSRMLGHSGWYGSDG